MASIISSEELSLGRSLSVRESQFVARGRRGGEEGKGEEEEEEVRGEKYEEARSRWNGSRLRLELSDP
ncbi:hypothetical protein HZH66_002635 [Vespula vulgaris]|uniref:Uncharacterized protein n=1 Tax=Vespula vulgaris TaxID=7454 RepID=A0A834KK69_VESVU|nr:hypothetical protein HZH66_002635 [Vespula vulgaris]